MLRFPSMNIFNADFDDKKGDLEDNNNNDNGDVNDTNADDDVCRPGQVACH